MTYSKKTDYFEKEWLEGSALPSIVVLTLTGLKLCGPSAAWHVMEETLAVQGEERVRRWLGLKHRIGGV